ncbi:MAG: hypothetical protein M1814_004024 [Vezdaea aestivalis]|nr:MAG: hypothetical protein M1814_004024 [Vezdaea aestivalis]
MASKEEIKAQISQLTGAIDDQQQKTRSVAGRTASPSLTIRSSLSLTHPPAYRVTRPSYPYPQSRGNFAGRTRGSWHAARAPQTRHRNRTLIVKGQLESAALASVEGAEKQVVQINPEIQSTAPKAEPSYVLKNDRHNQLINTKIYDQTARTRNQAIEETANRKALLKKRREMTQVSDFAQKQATSGHQASSGSPPEIEINGLRFRLLDAGSKLQRIYGTEHMIRAQVEKPPRRTDRFSDKYTSAKATPKRTKVAGVDFVRSQHGNLYRANAVKHQRSRSQKPGELQKRPELCKSFTITGKSFCFAPFSSQVIGDTNIERSVYVTGTCQKGSRCRYIHDPKKVAICKDFLKTGVCSSIDCDLSHDLTPERVPVCVHFLKGRCSKADCRFTHVAVAPDARVCPEFARLGYCEAGAKCAKKHVNECPSYADTGTCSKKDCQLKHIDRASKLRKAGYNMSHSNKESGDDDIVSSDEAGYDEIGSDDFDSDGFTEDLLPDGGDSTDLNGEADFVHF